MDLKDALFHVSVHPPHRKYLRFAHAGVNYEFTVPPFGLSLNLRVFSLCVEAALMPLRLARMRNSDVFRRLAGNRRFQTESAEGHPAVKPRFSWLQSEPRQKLFGTISKRYVLWIDLNSVRMRAQLSARRI